jgi:hypothetical protein
MSIRSHDPEKKTALREVESAVKELSSDERALAFTPKQQKVIIRRIDIRLVVTLGCLYCISLLDRTNLGAASVAGLVALAPLLTLLLTVDQNANRAGHG